MRIHILGLILFSVFMQVNAETLAQNISIDRKNTTIREVLNILKKQTDYVFIHDSKVLDQRKIDIELKNASIQEILDECFRELPFEYSILGKNILIKYKALPLSIQKEIVNEELVKKVQELQVSGLVKDEEGNVLSGVSVTVKGSNQGTVTDQNGKYTLVLEGSNSILVFSFIGFVSQDVAVASQRVINVEMKEYVGDLDEVVVIGYGTARKSDLTGSVQRVSGETFKNQPVTQLGEMLAGTVSGFYGTQGTSAEGGGSLEVRGPTSLTGGTSPLIVLDGVIYSGSLADINPSDIETIDILKDASSTAVFGAKAASGVVLVTTKKGRTGKPVINFTAKSGLSMLANDSFGPLDAQGYEDFRRDFFRTQGTGLPDWYWNDPNHLPAGVTLEQWRTASSNPNADNTAEYLSRLNFFPTEAEQYRAGKTTDWAKEVFRTGLNQDYDISINGGSDQFKYYWSMGYLDNEGIIRGDAFSALRSRINVDFKINNWLNVGTNTQVAVRDNSSVPAAINDIQSMGPYSKVYEDNGDIKWYPNDYYHVNPLINHAEQDRLRKVTALFSALYGNVTLPYGFEYKLSFQPRLEYRKDYNFWGPKTILGVRDHVGGYGTREDRSLNAWMVDNILTWKKNYGIHNFDATFLYNAEKTKTYLSNGQNETFLPNQALIYHGLQFGSKPGLKSDDTEAGGNALMARLNYSLLGKYLFTASVRRDGYSAFGQANNKATFPAAALAWIISDENFFPDNDVLNRMKLRLSWGINGNRDIGIYAALAQIGTNFYYDGTNLQMGLFNNSLANPGLRWEKTEAFNIGLDLGLLKNRIDVSADFYSMTTTDLLMNRQLPRITGFTNITANLGELGNRGFDLAVNTQNVNRSSFSWRSSLVLSMNRNKIKRLFGDFEDVEINGQIVKREIPDYTNQWFPGQAIDAVWEYDVTGVWQLDEADEAAKFGMRPGDYKAKDVDGSKSYDALIDKIFIGHKKPRARLGLRNDFSFLTNFTASIFLRADLGHIENFKYALHESTEYDRRGIWNVPYWTPTNGNNEYARTSEVHGAYDGGLRIFKSRSFLRVQDISFSYTLPKHIVERINAEGLRLFISARNPFTFTKWPGYDPESWNNGAGNDMPMPKSFSLGLSLSL